MLRPIFEKPMRLGYHWLGKKAGKPSENLVLGRDSRGFYSLPWPRCSAARSHTRSTWWPAVQSPFVRCSHDPIKAHQAITSQSHFRKPPSDLAPAVSRVPKHPLPKPSPRRSHPCFRTLSPGTSHLWRRPCSSAPCAEGSLRPLSDP